MTTTDPLRATSPARFRSEVDPEVSRDTSPTHRLTPTSTPSESVPNGLSSDLVAEYRAVLSELDWLVATLGVRPPAEGATSAPPSEPRARPIPTARVAAPEPPPEELWGVPSPYLDERIAAARAVAS